MIRPYRTSDYEMIASWWGASTGSAPFRDSLLEDGTFILEINQIPSMALTVLLTQSKEMAYVHAFIKNPLWDGINLENTGADLWAHCAKYASDRGYARLICFAHNPKLQAKYERFGFKPIMNNLTSLSMELNSTQEISCL